jgi:two-component system response regulator
MPFLDGCGVLRRLRAAPRTWAVPVVVLTTSLEERDLRDAYRAGANSYLRKPVDYGEFVIMMHLVAHYWLALNQTPALTEKEAADA